jgi:exonuclease III
MNSNYYLPSEFRKKTTDINIKSNFSLAHLNIRSITNKFDHFKELLDSLDTEFKIIGLSETWLNDNTNDAGFDLPTCNYVGTNRTNKKGAGVGIYTAKQLKYKIRKDLNTNIEETIESVFY